MSGSAAAVIEQFFERYERRGVEAALELVAPDAVLVVPPSMSAEPDTYEGHDGARRYFGGFEGAIDDVRFELLEVSEPLPGKVLASMRVNGRGAATGIDVTLDAALACAIRDGLVVRIEAHPDLESAREAIAHRA